MLHFATLFDRHYLSRGLALRHSLRANKAIFTLFVLCLDETTYNFFRQEKAQDTIPIMIGELEAFDHELLLAKGNRNWTEYIFTLSPVLPLFILENFPHIERIITLDADIYFFSDPSHLLKEYEHYSILVSPHRFTRQLKDRERYGKFNVSFQAFKNNAQGLACLRYWRQQCLHWCNDFESEGKFADQKYLDEWPHLYKDDLGIIAHEGACLAPWNIANSKLTKKAGILYNQSDIMIFYHFHGLRFIRSRILQTGLDDYDVPKHSFLMNNIYAPYAGLLRDFGKVLGQQNDAAIRMHSKYSREDIQSMIREREFDFFFSSSSIKTIRIYRLYQKYGQVRKKVAKFIYGRANKP